MDYRRHAQLLADGDLAVNLKLPASVAPPPFFFFNKYGGGRYLKVKPGGEVVYEHRDPLGHHDCYHYGDGRLLCKGAHSYQSKFVTH